MTAPRSSRALAKFEQIVDMNRSALKVGDRIRATARTGEVTEWKLVPGSEWWERVDAAAPVDDGRKVVGDVREQESLALKGEG